MKYQPSMFGMHADLSDEGYAVLNGRDFYGQTCYKAEDVHPAGYASVEWMVSHNV
jgi:hypothetical protein